jgi:type II secretory pathway component GspD/PulD (secretin)
MKWSSGTFDIKLQALIEEGKADLLSNPKIAVIVGMPGDKGKEPGATITTGEEVPYQDAQVVGNQTVLATKFKEVGVKLNVNPLEISGNYVKLYVRPEVSGLTRYETVVIGSGQSATLPVFAKRVADTTVWVRDGQSFVLGGLYRKDVTRTRRGVPIIKNIPILGFLFRSEKQVSLKRELIFFLTPHILTLEEPSAAPIPAAPADAGAAPTAAPPAPASPAVPAGQ